ncbi:MAG TPA: GNAT family N-acetyltransferase [Dongiaceae bacterium]|jgi:ribosomal-protein-alanine N-acetyltransferase
MAAIGSTGPAELETPRLHLRNWTDEDLPAFAAMNADAETMRYFPKPLGRKSSDALAALIRSNLAKHGWGLWAIEVRTGPKFAGFVGLAIPSFKADFMPAVEIGWRLARDCWGRGYATEGAQAALTFAFGRLNLAEVVSFTVVGNERSRAVMERLGMIRKPAEDFDHPMIAAGSPVRRHVLYRLTQKRWRANLPK